MDHVKRDSGVQWGCFSGLAPLAQTLYVNSYGNYFYWLIFRQTFSLSVNFSDIIYIFFLCSLSRASVNK